MTKSRNGTEERKMKQSRAKKIRREDSKQILDGPEKSGLDFVITELIVFNTSTSLYDKHVHT